MQTKLVYVLTCAPEATYIEQALISIWSARYHNADAHIVLLVDDKTNQLLVGKRAEILEYISEKIVISFVEVNASMIYRSRFIKTQVRQLVKGDILFIDSDTVVNHSLAEIDQSDCEVGAVCESNLPIEQFDVPLYESICGNANRIGWSLQNEKYYFSSGVIYAKDTPAVYRLFERWHQYWQKGLDMGVNIDQPSLAKANIACEHIIQRINDKWNCIMFTYPRWAKNASILHFASYRNMSFLFSKRVLKYIKDNGLTSYIKQYILHPTETYIPFDSEFYYYQVKDYISSFKVLYRGIKKYASHIDVYFNDYPSRGIVYKLLKHKAYIIAIWLIILLRWRCIRKGKYIYKENICAK